MEGSVAAPVPPQPRAAQDSPDASTPPRPLPRTLLPPNNTTPSDFPFANMEMSAQDKLERALATTPIKHTPEETNSPKESTAISTNPFLCNNPFLSIDAISPTSESGSQDIKMAAQSSLDRAISSAPQTPPKALLSTQVEKAVFLAQATLNARNNTIVTPQGIWQNVTSPSMPQHTLPAVQNFIQMAFQTVQRSSQPQLPATSIHRAFPPTLVVTPRSPQTSLPNPFPSLQKSTTLPTVAPTQEAPKPFETSNRPVTVQRSVSLNGESPSISETKSTSIQTPPKNQNCVASTFYKSALSNDKPREAQNATPNRPVLVAKRRQSPKSTKPNTESVVNTQSTPNAQKLKSPEKSKAKNSPVKQNTSRVAQTFKEYQNRAQGSQNAQANAGASNKPSWRKVKVNDEETEEIDPKKRVLVSGFPPYTQAQDLIRVLSKFGKCQVDSCRNRLAVVTFENEAQAMNAQKASDDINIYGEYIEIKPYTNPKHVEELYKAYKKVISIQKGQDITMPDKIDLSGDFYQQLDNIQKAIRITTEQAMSINNLYNDLEMVLQQEWPGCVAIPFGSIPMGLGIKSSDADCYVELPAVLRPRGAAGGASAFVTRARRLLQQYPQVFSHLIAIPRANTPIVKFKHLPSGFHCDVSAKTPLGAQNSKLIKLLLEHDPRLLRVAILIKYWAKVHDLSGTGRLTNYALTMMVIFYLQQTNIPFLPPVVKLQQEAESRYIVDYWNAGFSTRKLQITLNKTPVHDLMGGFFEFYDKFDFDNEVMCPFLGRTVKKLAFDAPATLPLEFARYVGNVRDNLASPLRHGTPFCVQDPFEQSHNVASSIGSKLATEIRTYIKFAADAYAADRANGCRNFLRTILLKKPQVRVERLSASTVLHLIPRVRGEITDPDWRTRLKEIIVDTIFEKILRLTLERAIDDEKTKERHRRAKIEREKYSGEIHKPVWKRKKHHGSVLLPSDTPQTLVARQCAVTDSILARPGPETKLKFELELWFREGPRNFNISFRMLDGDVDSFRHFVLFMHMTVFDWFKVLLRPFQEPIKGDMRTKLVAEELERAEAKNGCTISFERTSLAPVPVSLLLDPEDIVKSLDAVSLDSATDSSDSAKISSH